MPFAVDPAPHWRVREFFDVLPGIVEVGRDEAARAAARELSKGIYLAEEPGVLERVLGWIREQLDALLAAASGAMPGGIFGLAALVLLLVLVGSVIWWRVGALARATGRSGRVFDPSEPAHRTAAEHRAAADRAADAGDLTTAAQERFRATVRCLEERGRLEERPSRTADEVADELGEIAPDLVAPMRAAATVFDTVTYGGRSADHQMYRTVCDADEAADRSRRRPGAARGLMPA